MARNIIIGCMILGLLAFTQSAVSAQYDYELAYGYSGRDSGHRSAVDMDDWLERGRAVVAESPVFPDGIRLTAEGKAEAYGPGLASAIYYFTVPRWAQYLKISIRYKDIAQDDKIAGRLWIKSTDKDMRGETGDDEEAPLYGDTFVLRSEQSSETITVPTSRHVEDGRVEMHIVAEGSDCIDVRDIRVEYLDTRPQITVVHRTYNDYWDEWPRHRYAYHYYYWGPLFWPKTLVVYECWDVPSPFYWITWRPWFFVNIIRVHHHYPWWGPRRYTVAYHSDVKKPPIKRRNLLRKRLKERHVHVTKIIHAKPVTRKTVRSPVQTHSPQKQKIRLKKEVKTSRTFEAKGNQNPTQRQLKQQPIRADKEREKPMVNTQTKTVKRPPVFNKPNSPSARPTHTAPQHIQKAQPKPRTAEQIPRPRSVTREKTVQVPAQKQLKQPDSVDPKANKSVQPTSIRRPNTGQLNQKKKEAEKPTVNTQTKTMKKGQVINKPAARSAHPSPTVPQHIQKEQPQPRAVEHKVQHRPVVQKSVQTPVQMQSSKHQKMEKTIQMQPNIQRGNRSQSHSQIRQPRPHAEQGRLREKTTRDLTSRFNNRKK